MVCQIFRTVRERATVPDIQPGNEQLTTLYRLFNQALGMSGLGWTLGTVASVID